VIRSRAAAGAAFLVVPLLAGCVASPPRDPNDLCAIFREKRGWYHAAMRAEDRWGIPSSIPMAMMRQESGFHPNLHTQRTYILWFIPWGYVTTAYGYPQAKTDIWHTYERATDQSASRENFADSLDFMDWYMTRTKNLDNVPIRDALHQYLAYHEGWSGFRHGSWRAKPWLTGVAARVSSQAALYGRQYGRCHTSLRDSGFWNWLF